MRIPKVLKNPKKSKKGEIQERLARTADLEEFKAGNTVYGAETNQS